MPTDTPWRIAVIEDHVMARESLVKYAGQWPGGQVVLEAENGLDYERKCAEQGHIHLALVDLRMPVRDGYETMRWMRREQPRTRALAVSYDPEPEVIRRILRANACGVLNKAMTVEELHRALDNIRRTDFHYNELVSRQLRLAVEQEPKPDELWARLTDREREVVLLYTDPKVRGLEEVAARLGISYNTAETHRRNAAAKLGGVDKAEMVHLVNENGWREQR